MDNEERTIAIETLMDNACTECGTENSMGAYLNDDTNTYWIECFHCEHEYNSKIS